LGVLARVLAILWFPAAIVTVLLAFVVVGAVWLVTAAFDRDRLVAGRILRGFGSALARAFPLWRVRVEGSLPAGAFVLAANHRSWLDVFVLARLPREMKWVAKAELFRAPLVGWLLRMSGDIPVWRGDSSSGAGAVEKASGYLQRGIPVVFFPEGTRGRDGVLKPFKAGAFDVAAAAGVPVVPVAITGTAEGMPPGTYRILPASVVVRILEPIRGDAAALRGDTRERIAAALGAA
jgi:1-acyl-sn-glycerol-3-phosphate acyltransferase